MAQWFVNDQEETILASPLKFFNSNTFISPPPSSLSLSLSLSLSPTHFSLFY